MVNECTAIFKDEKDRNVLNDQEFEDIKNDNLTDNKELMDRGAYHQCKVRTVTEKGVMWQEITYHTGSENNLHMPQVQTKYKRLGYYAEGWR